MLHQKFLIRAFSKEEVRICFMIEISLAESIVVFLTYKEARIHLYKMFSCHFHGWLSKGCLFLEFMAPLL